MGNLKGKTAIVTGSTSGMGRGIAELFAGEGANIVVSGRDEKRGDEIVRGMKKKGGRAVFSEVNRMLVGEAVETFGGVDILILSNGELGNGSITALHVFPDRPVYCASKGALIPLVKQIALDYGPDIRINLICPAQVDTPLLRNSVKAFENPESIIQETIDRLPLKRLGLPQDIAKAALYLVSGDASWVTGSCFVIDGGFLCT